MTPKVLLVTTARWPSAPRIAQAFAALGAEVHGFYPRGNILGLSAHLKSRHIYEPVRSGSLPAALTAMAPDLVVPLDDRAAALLAAVPHTDERYPLIARSLGDPAVYSNLATRSAFMAAADACRIRTPETFAVTSVGDLEAALKSVGLPAVLKTDNSWGGDGVAVVRTRDEAREVFARWSTPPSLLRGIGRALWRGDVHFAVDAFHGATPQISIQQFIAGRPATSSISCWQGTVLAANHFDVAVFENAGPACVVRPVDCPEMARAARLIAERFHLSGLHGLDFIRDRDGRVHLLEINPRSTQTSHLALGPGRDLVAPLLGALTGTPIADRDSVTECDSIALFPQEWSRDPASAHLVSAYHDVPWDEPAVLHASLPASDKSPEGAKRLFTTWKPSPRTLPTP